MTEPKKKAEVTEEQKSLVLGFFKGLFRFVGVLFGIFVGTAMLLDVASNGPSWSNVPWILVSLWLLLRH